jgi:glycosyltransferase involved in cell wall biosynthesis
MMPKPLLVCVFKLFELYFYIFTIIKMKHHLRGDRNNKNEGNKHKTRILFYHISGLSFGGTEKFLQIIAKYIDKDKFDIYYMYSPKPRVTTGPTRLDGRLNYLQGNGIHLIEFDYDSIDTTYPYIVRGMSPSVHDVIRDNNIDLFISAGSGYAEFPFNIIKNIPVVLINIFGVPNTQNNIKTNICISHAVQEKVMRVTPKDKTEVIYIQSEQPKDEFRELGLELRRKFGIKDTEVVFGRIGRADDSIFDPIGINAFEQVVKQDASAHYIIMSPPPVLVNIVKERNIPNVHFLPPSGNEDDVWSFHFSLDALAHFRLDGESFGLNIAESMIAGNPIITHKSHIWNAHLEYLNSEFSFVCEKDDVTAYADAMRQILQAKKSGTIDNMKTESKKVASDLFLIEHSIKKIESIIHKANKKPKVDVSIYTRPGSILFQGCILYYTKWFARKILHIKRGPSGVLNSLIRGLNSIDISFNINPPINQSSPVVHVISNPEALRWAVKNKACGNIKHIIAGPNISILPTDDGGILSNPLIDTLIVPSNWSRDAHIKSNNALTKKIKVWPAGVSIPKLYKNTEVAQHEYKILVFIKHAPQEIVAGVLESLKEIDVPFTVIEYGKFLQKDYFNLLKKSKGMIYLQEIESQGIALQEAWSFDVPTLVWNKGSYTYPGTDITVTGNVSAPYQTEATGLFFTDPNDFNTKIQLFLSKIDSFSPREYCINNLSDTASANIYKDILNEYIRE